MSTEIRSTPLHRAGHLSKAQASRLRTLIREHVKAQIEDSGKGGGDPADCPIIEAEALTAERKLHDYIKRLTQ